MKSTFEYYLSNAVRKVYGEPGFSERGYKQYRIMLYAYMFGSVTEDDLYFIELDNLEEYHVGEVFEERHKRQCLLRYFTTGKKPYLKKVDDLYFISESGVSFLWNYFVSNNIIPENFKEEFFDSRRRRVDNSKHGHIVGAAVLMLSKVCGYDFLVEPAFYHLQRSYQNENEYCRPDALLSGSFGELYVEADRGTERKAKLREKMERYERHIFQDEYDEHELPKIVCYVLHVGTMVDQEKNLNDEWNLVKKINEVCILMKDLFCDLDELAYGECIRRIVTYRPDMLEGFSETVKNYITCINNNISDWEVNQRIEDFLEDSVSDVSYQRRKERIIECAIESPAMVKSLECGNSLIVAPLLSCHSYFRCVYYDDGRIERLKRWIRGQSNNIIQIEYMRKRRFLDEVSGQQYVFLNVFEITVNNGEIVYVCIESIAADLGAVCRVNRAISNKNYIDNLYIICADNNKKMNYNIKEKIYKYINRKDGIKLEIINEKEVM